MMQEIHSYQIKVLGKLDESFFNASSPHRIKLEKSDPTGSLFTVYTDQSGLIGLMRYLHQQGYVILSAYWSDGLNIRKEN
jgi:hypothetical protein